MENSFDPMYASWGQMLAPYVWPATGLALLALPGFLVPWFWVGKRRFHRRNIAGVEEFGSYPSSVGNRLLEELVDRVSLVFLFVFLCSFSVALAGFIFGRY